MEGIASNILADRLKRLMELGMLTRADDPTHKQKAIYSLTEMAITLVPILAHLGAWGRVWLPVSEELSIRAELLEKGGPPMWEKFMDESAPRASGDALRHAAGSTVRATLQAGYEAVVARKAHAPYKPGPVTNYFPNCRPALLSRAEIVIYGIG